MGLRLLSVNIGRPRVIGTRDGAEVLSGFVKVPVAASSVRVGETGIVGDGQADLSVHGGPDKAVYCYPTDHWPWWQGEKTIACRAATFGENLTVEGLTEDAAAIGDRFGWGDVVLEMSQPRAPCYKFAMATGREDAPGLMTVSGRTGWYFRVIRPGLAPVGACELARLDGGGGPSVRETFFAVMDSRASEQSRRRVAAARGLARSWHDAVLRRLDL